jgi:CPA1 family monovalent cation:H+ antiporter
LAVGGVIGTIVALLTQRYDLAWVEQTLSLVTAYGGYILAEDLGGSGVIGVVTAGLVIGNLSLTPGERPQKRSTMIEFWEFIIFLVNSIVFLLLGDQVSVSLLFRTYRHQHGRHWGSVAIAGGGHLRL